MQDITARQGGTVNHYLSAPLKTGLRGLGLIAEQQGSAAWQYHLPDALGSVRQVTDPLAQVILSQQYDPFGGLLASAGATRSAYGFAGEEQDPTTDQLYLRARTYNPATGRFLQQDSVIGSPNQPRTLHRYAYAFNNPVNYRDPSGHTGESVNTRTPGPQTNYRNQQVGSSWAGALNVRQNTPNRSVNSIGRDLWQPFSDPMARQRSQGHRPKPCGVGDFIAGMGSSFQRSRLSSDLLMLALNSQPFLRQQMQGANAWLNWQVDTAAQMWEHRDWRMAASLTFGAGTALIMAGLVGSGVGIPLLVLAGAGTMAANSMFNTTVYGGDARQNLIKDFYSEGAETAFEVVGSALFGAPGAFAGSVIGAGVGQIISNAQYERPLTEGLLASMALSGVFEGVSGAGGYVGGRRFGGALSEANLTAARLRQGDFTGRGTRLRGDELRRALTGGTESGGLGRRVRVPSYTVKGAEGTRQFVTGRGTLGPDGEHQFVMLDTIETIPGVPISNIPGWTLEWIEHARNTAKKTRTDCLMRACHPKAAATASKRIPKDPVKVWDEEFGNFVKVGSDQTPKFKTNPDVMVEKRNLVGGGTGLIVGWDFENDTYGLYHVDNLPKNVVPMGADIDSLAFIREGKNGWFNLGTDTPLERQLREELNQEIGVVRPNGEWMGMFLHGPWQAFFGDAKKAGKIFVITAEGEIRYLGDGSGEVVEAWFKYRELPDKFHEPVKDVLDRLQH